MKRLTKKLSLSTQSVRLLAGSELGRVHGGLANAAEAISRNDRCDPPPPPPPPPQ